MNIARTRLSSNIFVQHRHYFAKLANDAVLRLKGNIDSHAMQIIKNWDAVKMIHTKMKGFCQIKRLVQIRM